MILTDDQRAAVEHSGHTLLDACPGSGKTRAIIARLLRCVDVVRDTPRRVACITYTNAAVYEIEHRLRVYGRTGDEEFCDVSTIHAFCLNNVVRFFAWRVAGYNRGCTVLAPDSDRYGEIVDEIVREHRLSNDVRDAFQYLNRGPDGAPQAGSFVPAAAARTFWERLQTEGYVDFPTVIYLAYCLCRDFPSVARGLASRFQFVLVDEVQDTSELQIEFLKLIAAHASTTFFLVGDPMQSIMGFAGARPELMTSFAAHVGARTDIRLTANFRSSVPIIERAERLCPRTPAMVSAGEARAFLDAPVRLHCGTAFEAIADMFLPALDGLGIPYGRAAVLAPQWFKLFPLARQLRECGVPVVGPGARPYKRTNLFGRFAEQVCAYIDVPKPLYVHQAERELFVLLQEVTGRAEFRVYSYAGRVTVYRILRAGQELHQAQQNAVDWLRLASRAFAEILIRDGFLAESQRTTLDDAVEGLCADMTRNRVDTSNLSTADLGMFADPERNLKLLTMHSAKGREFDAVALVDLHEGKIPHWKQTERDESRRLFYVSITRARRLLFLITDNDDQRNRPSSFLQDLGAFN